MIARNFYLIVVLGAAMAASCSSTKGPTAVRKMENRPFGKTPEGENVDLYTLTNAKGVEVSISTYGGDVVSLKVPDRAGKFADVVLGFDDFQGYLLPPPYFGALVGRYGNRIAKGMFSLDGVKYKLAVNNGENSLHGGLKGFDKRVWKAKQASPESLELSYLSKDGEEGYPGNLSSTVTYTLTDNNELKIDYVATTDKKTVLNLTNHSYFNLAGEGEGDILGHVVMIDADRFTPTDPGLIPTGELRKVDGTVFDFRKPRAIGERINVTDEQLLGAKGYDQNWVLNRTGDGLQLAARVKEPHSGRVMEVLTTQPGLQFYTGNFLDGTIHGKGGKIYGQRSAFCMETQHFPDSPNHPDFPTTELKPGETYHHTTMYRFSAE